MSNTLDNYEASSVPIPRWYRTDGGIIGGVCEGIGERFAIEPNWIRVAFAASVIFAGFGVLIYALAWFFLPEKDAADQVHESKVLGVCFALAQKYTVEVGLVRIAIAFLIINSIGLGIVLYIVAYFLMENSSWEQYLDG